MRAVDIIQKKRNKGKLSLKELKFFIENYTKDIIKDYQMSALLMAIYFNGMDKDETNYLTECMIKSGDTIDLSAVEGIKVDKHSTGGVGDKVSIILAPLLAACGLKVAKLSGRGLGHTGGTIDKLESIKGFNVSLTEESFLKQVNDIGVALGGQTANITPADKLMYALRDVTATVDSIPLIAASIMSKKIASGTDVILLDVKVGKGAFMKTLPDASKLAEYMIEIGKYYNKTVIVYLTSMDEPLGLTVGNANEIKESIDVLNQEGTFDITNIVNEMAIDILKEVNKISTEEAKDIVIDKLKSKEALNKFYDFVKIQEGSIEELKDLKEFVKTKYSYEVKSDTDGYIHEIDALNVGVSSMLIGAGRNVKTDTIDHKAGIELVNKVGFKVNKGDTLCIVNSNKEVSTDYLNNLKDAFIIKDNEVQKQTKILKKFFIK